MNNYNSTLFKPGKLYKTLISVSGNENIHEKVNYAHEKRIDSYGRIFDIKQNEIVLYIEMFVCSCTWFHVLYKDQSMYLPFIDEETGLRFLKELL